MVFAGSEEKLVFSLECLPGSQDRLVFIWESREAGSFYLEFKIRPCLPAWKSKEGCLPGGQEKLKLTWESREAEVYLGVKRS
jgi:hypothetical protein